MKRILASLALVPVLLAGCAATSRPQPDSRSASATTEPCVLESASRIPARSGGCSITPGRAYSQQDVQRTGQTNAADALQMLDPSITVHH